MLLKLFSSARTYWSLWFSYTSASLCFLYKAILLTALLDQCAIIAEKISSERPRTVSVSSKLCINVRVDFGTSTALSLRVPRPLIHSYSCSM